MTIHQLAYKPQKGFTLIETIIYLALFSILFNGVLMSAYTFIISAEQISAQVTSENESAFIVRKINTLLASANTIIKPTPDTTGDTLIFSTYAGNEYTINANDGMVKLSKDANPEIPLTSERITFDTFSVIHRSAQDGTPRSVEYSFTVDGEVAGSIRNYFSF